MLRIDRNLPERRARRPLSANLRRRWGSVFLAGCAALAISCDDVSVTAVGVASVRLTPADGSIAQGDTLRLRATIHDASGNPLVDRPVTWSTDRPDVAAVESNGLVRGLMQGAATIRATSGGVTEEASITVMEGPVIVLSTTELNFQGRAGGLPTDTRSVEISNGGGGTLTGIRFSVVHPGGEPAGWLEAGLRETSAPAVLVVRGHPSGLPTGKYRPQIRVTSDHAANSPQVIDITFEVVEEAPAIEVSPMALGFAASEAEAAPSPQTVSVTNAGAGDLTGLGVEISYTNGEPTGWLSAELSDTAAPTELTLQVNPAGLESPVVLDAVVEVTSPVAPESIGVLHVRFRLGAPPPESEPPCEELDRIRADLKAIEDAAPGSSLADKIEDVRRGTEAAYSMRCLRFPSDRQAAAGNIEGAVGDMEAAIGDGLISPSQGTGFMDRLILVSRDMADEAIEAAETRDRRRGHINRAKRLVSEGDQLRSEGSFKEAAATYGSAISAAEGA